MIVELEAVRAGDARHAKAYRTLVEAALSGHYRAARKELVHTLSSAG